MKTDIGQTSSRSRSMPMTAAASEAPLSPPARPGRWGEAACYGWSEDKARQYAEPLRADFGAFVRAKGFRLE